MDPPQSKIYPMTMAELLPNLGGIISKETMQSLTAKKAPRNTLAITRTNEKIIKPLTIAEIKADIIAINGNSSRKTAQHTQQNTSTKKKNWNSSVKVDKKINRTASGSVKHSAVRKMLNFPANPKPPIESIPTVNAESPRFSKPELKVKKSLYTLQQSQTIKSTNRISGIYNITQTPRERTIPKRSRIMQANKENLPKENNVNKENLATHKPVTPKKINPNAMPDTPLSNDSWKSNGDDSFLQKEKEVCSIEKKIETISEEYTLENIAEVSPPASTPFKEYRGVHKYFNDSSVIEHTQDYDDNTIMCFDKSSTHNKNTNEMEASVMSLLSDLFNKANISNNKKNTEIDDLLQEEQQIERSIQMIDNVIQNLIDVKETQLKLLEQTRNKRYNKTECQNKTLVENRDIDNVISEQKVTTENPTIPVNRPSVIKTNSKSTCYKEPKKTMCLRKKVFCKSMPNISTDTASSETLNNDKAFDMYMKLKQQMDFLNTPVTKRAESTQVPDTPAITSHNLQMQLDKLYGS